MFQKGNLVTPTDTADGPPLFEDRSASQRLSVSGTYAYGKAGETFICEDEGRIGGSSYHIMRRLAGDGYAFCRKDGYVPGNYRWRAL